MRQEETFRAWTLSYDMFELWLVQLQNVCFDVLRLQNLWHLLCHKWESTIKLQLLLWHLDLTINCNCNRSCKKYKTAFMYWFDYWLVLLKLLQKYHNLVHCSRKLNVHWICNSSNWPSRWLSADLFTSCAISYCLLTLYVLLWLWVI